MSRYRHPDAPKHYCCYCQRWLVYPLRYTLEHIVPRSRGGSYKKANLLPCCRGCNTWSGNKPLTVFKRQVHHYLTSGNLHPRYSEALHYAVLDGITNVLAIYAQNMEAGVYSAHHQQQNLSLPQIAALRTEAWQ